MKSLWLFCCRALRARPAGPGPAALLPAGGRCPLARPGRSLKPPVAPGSGHPVPPVAGRLADRPVDPPSKVVPPRREPAEVCSLFPPSRQPLCIPYCLGASWTTSLLQQCLLARAGTVPCMVCDGFFATQASRSCPESGRMHEPHLPLLEVGVWSLLTPSERRPFAQETATASAL